MKTFMTADNAPHPPTPPSILVADDDRRVRELLEIALTAHGFNVFTASDGEEAVKRVLCEHPDLVVLDVRLPKKSGLEVCQALRGGAGDPSIPIILVSAVAETDSRVQAFQRGADDYLAKPFSPKELIARIRRQLARAQEIRDARRHAEELERELSRVQEEARRAHAESRHEQHLRELAFGVGRELHRSPDLDTLAQRLLMAVQSRLGVGAAALLALGRTGDDLEPYAIRGDGFERIAGLRVRRGGELARLVAGLGRPVLRAELERMDEVRGELAPFVASGLVLLAPVRGADGLDAMLAVEERKDGREHSKADAEMLRGLCEIAAVAIQNGLRLRLQADQLMAMAAETASLSPEAAATRNEAAAMIDRAASASFLSPRARDVLVHAVGLGDWGVGPEGRSCLARLRGLDPTGRICDLERLLDEALTQQPSWEEPAPEDRRMTLLLRAGLAYAEARELGASADEAMAHAMAQAGSAMDPATRLALGAATRGTIEFEDHVA